MRLAASPRILVLAALVTLCAGEARAQYSFNPNNPDEQGLATRYFGSVKDEAGGVLEGATIIINHAFTFVTDVAGRYAGYAPADKSAKTSLIGCAKPGYAFVRLNRRAGAKGKAEWVQADCVLRPKS